jgi:hypothetical protein
MTLKDIVNKLGFTVCCAEDKLREHAMGGYAGDLLSDVIANSKTGDVWITMQVHANIVAVAVLKELSAIVLVNGRKPSEDTLKKATEEKIPILVSKLSAFETAGKLYDLGIGKETYCNGTPEICTSIRACHRAAT